MKWSFIFLILFIPFVFGMNETFNETNITLNETGINSSFPLSPTLSFVQLSGEEGVNEMQEIESGNLTLENQAEENLSNDSSLVLEKIIFVEDTVLKFYISSFLEGDEYFLDLFEFLLSSFSGEGEEYEVDFFTDEMSSSSSSFSGSEYSGKSGDFGLLSTPPTVVTSSYCGDGNCDSGETCSSCSADCGECSSTEDSSGGSVGGSTGVYQSKVEDSVVVIESEIMDEDLPEQLFDIRMDLESLSLEDSRDLEIIVTYESFGSVQTFVNFSLEIFDEFGESVYFKKGNLVVSIEEIRRYGFEDFSVDDGEYEVVLTVLYGENIRDEFRQEFTVDERWLVDRDWQLAVVVGVVILFFIVGFFVIRNRFGVTKRVGRRDYVYKKHFHKISRFGNPRVDYKRKKKILLKKLGNSSKRRKGR